MLTFALQRSLGRRPHVRGACEPTSSYIGLAHPVEDQEFGPGQQPWPGHEPDADPEERHSQQRRHGEADPVSQLMDHDPGRHRRRKCDEQRQECQNAHRTNTAMDTLDAVEVELSLDVDGRQCSRRLQAKDPLPPADLLAGDDAGDRRKRRGPYRRRRAGQPSDHENLSAIAASVHASAARASDRLD